MEETTYKKNTGLLVLLSVGVVSLILIADQYFKFWIKTHMRLGENIPVFGDWFILHFTENNGMAFGLQFAGSWGKLFLTFFRLIAVGGIIYYLIYQIRNHPKVGTIVLISLILAGALGNIVDSVFYGQWFTESRIYNIAEWADGNGYAGYFRGKVVDMLYFPIIETHYPSWFPIMGGREFIFFRPVFNIADAAISSGVFAILLFKRNLFQINEKPEEVVNEKDLAIDNTAN